MGGLGREGRKYSHPTISLHVVIYGPPFWVVIVVVALLLLRLFPDYRKIRVTAGT